MLLVRIYPVTYTTMVELINNINFSCLGSDNPLYRYSILIILNRPILVEQYRHYRKISDYVICADGAANRLFALPDKENAEFIPNEIIGDLDSIKPEVMAFYEKKGVKIVIKKEIGNTDLEKSLFISIEKLAYVPEESGLSNNKRFSFIILGASGGRIDHTISTYHHVYKYLTLYEEQLEETEIFMVSKSSISVFLKNGTNIIDSSDKIQNRAFGYSILSLTGESLVKITNETDDTNSSRELKLRFGENKYFFKKKLPNKIRVVVEGEPSALIYTTTTLYFNKFA